MVSCSKGMKGAFISIEAAFVLCGLYKSPLKPLIATVGTISGSNNAEHVCKNVGKKINSS